MSTRTEEVSKELINSGLVWLNSERIHIQSSVTAMAAKLATLPEFQQPPLAPDVRVGIISTRFHEDDPLIKAILKYPISKEAREAAFADDLPKRSVRDLERTRKEMARDDRKDVYVTVPINIGAVRPGDSISISSDRGPVDILSETFDLPCLLVSEANRRDHFRVKAERAAMQRELGRNATYCACNKARAMAKQKIPLVVLITRIGKRKLDDDNLRSSAKALRDGIADGLGINDGDEVACTWTYAQEVRATDPGVRVTIKARGE